MTRTGMFHEVGMLGFESVVTDEMESEMPNWNQRWRVHGSRLLVTFALITTVSLPAWEVPFGACHRYPPGAT